MWALPSKIWPVNCESLRTSHSSTSQAEYRYASDAAASTTYVASAAFHAAGSVIVAATTRPIVNKSTPKNDPESQTKAGKASPSNDEENHAEGSTDVSSPDGEENSCSSTLAWPPPVDLERGLA
ncbi:hypothetical protein HPB52_022755 [Rhipicephalus sanguineus]|uniref:Uncharacterized protein n=1 Tax=Rhipicephalus sanguineus TaxID=34632 RepID=A0A9D4QBW5_RHISA|nr:hypothetical protein HPB52_022755 [Rhipicephalus sanguineus]